MARYSSDFNAYARRVVKSFNQRVMRAERRGMKNLPSLRSVRELKAMFETEDDLKKELSELRKFNENRDALRIKELGNEARITTWEFDYIKDNLQDLKSYYDRELEKARQRYENQPFNMGIREDVLNLEERRMYLDRNLLELNKSELATFKRYLSNYQGRNRRDINFYDRFFEGFDFLMRVSGVDKSKIKYVQDRINSLTPSQFYELYKQHDVMGELFDVISSPERGEYYRKVREYEEEQKKKIAEELGVDAEAVNKKVDAIIENLDGWIEDAKKIAG